MVACANDGGLLPEQVWDGPDIPGRELIRGRPSGSAMPLVWAHAEYLKLRRSLREGRVYDLPPQTWQRYVAQRTPSPYAFWRFNHKLRTMPHGQQLRVETIVPSLVHWSVDGWQTVHDTLALDTDLGEYVADLPTAALASGARIDFTFFWPEADRWEQVDFHVVVEPPAMD
jgi:glucoamylase